jgi:hypothetical protein
MVNTSGLHSAACAVLYDRFPTGGCQVVLYYIRCNRVHTRACIVCARRFTCQSVYDRRLIRLVYGPVTGQGLHVLTSYIMFIKFVGGRHAHTHVGPLTHTGAHIPL